MFAASSSTTSSGGSSGVPVAADCGVGLLDDRLDQRDEQRAEPRCSRTVALR